jgi:alpha-glucosidase (family GH31 glycosyl hydrolase)
MKLEETLDIHGEANKDAIVQGEKYRITVLTSQLLRFEYNEDGIFEDRATQTVINRKFPVPKFKVVESENDVEVITEHIHLFYTKEKPSKNSLRIEVLGGISTYHSVYHYGEEFKTLGGTARTLDLADGEVPLEKGLLSKLGFSCLDDSRSLILKEDNWVEPRADHSIDFYFFGYARNYLDCLKDYYHLTGQTPVIPRFALGNWWSRYYEYSEESYKELIQRFEAEEIPLSVAVIDMDWHLVDIDKRFGSGWTGYTWNKELFPNPEAFLTWLHEKDMAVTLNVHPADGVKAHEEMYIDIAKELGVNYEEEESIAFDFTNQSFIDAYFTYLHHPNEDLGVDFWWIDWQSGDISKIEGMDPLWMLNHYHYLDRKERSANPLIFSRYAGPGSHRYPIGFSGDTMISWASLDFQPYFTATASNIGYSWWSHDIGGHMQGVRDDELAVRWVQFGVFSPIMRLHSYKSTFAGKEPWNYSIEAEKSMKSFLQLRHQMIPYLHTMNYLTANESFPLIQPMYYHHEWEEEAYTVKNQYYFGTECIVSPITSKVDPVTRKASVVTWLPEGDWYDFFSGRHYKGNRKLVVYRGMDEMPVFAKAGAIIPMDQEVKNKTDNPRQLKVKVFPGKRNTFTLIEDSSKLNHPNNEVTETRTKFSLESIEEKITFMIHEPTGDINNIPSERSYFIELINVEKTKQIVVKQNKKDIPFLMRYEEAKLVIEISPSDLSSEVSIVLQEVRLRENDPITEVESLLHQAQCSIPLKEKIFELVNSGVSRAVIIAELETLDVPLTLRQAIIERIAATG